MTELPKGYSRVLDKGYVGYVDHMGNDHTAVRAARASFQRTPDQFSEESNAKLINYLMRNNEMACFRHQVISMEVKMPLLIARQFYKYVVASSFTEDQLGWNESSRRYITENNEFYRPEPNEWRKAPDNKKQGSSEYNLSERDGLDWTLEVDAFYQNAVAKYEEALEEGIAPELARLFLPSYPLYVTCFWTASLNSLFHFLNERLDSHAQYEIRLYAEEIAKIVENCYPISYQAWKDNK